MAKAKTKTKVGIKKEEPVAPVAEVKTPPGKPPKRIRMLMSVANTRAFDMGRVFLVPQDVPVNTARSWIACGIAEEDKSAEDPPETK